MYPMSAEDIRPHQQAEFGGSLLSRGGVLLGAVGCYLERLLVFLL